MFCIIKDPVSSPKEDEVALFAMQCAGFVLESLVIYLDKSATLRPENIRMDLSLYFHSLVEGLF